jgi:hypothetical protein
MLSFSPVASFSLRVSSGSTITALTRDSMRNGTDLSFVNGAVL